MIKRELSVLGPPCQRPGLHMLPCEKDKDPLMCLALLVSCDIPLLLTAPKAKPERMTIAG